MPNDIEPKGTSGPEQVDMGLLQQGEGEAEIKLAEEQKATEAPKVEEPKAVAAPPADPNTAKILELQQKLMEMQQKIGEPKTPAEKKAEFKLLEILEADADKFILGGQETTTFVNDLLQKLARQHMQLTAAYLEEQLKPLREQLTPLQQSYQTQVIEKTTAEFIKAYPDLEKFSDVALEHAVGMLNGGRKFKDKEEFFGEVAKVTKAGVEKYRKALGVAEEEKQPQLNLPPPPADRPGAKASFKGKLDPEEEMMLSVING